MQKKRGEKLTEAINNPASDALGKTPATQMAKFQAKTAVRLLAETFALKNIGKTAACYLRQLKFSA